MAGKRLLDAAKVFNAARAIGKQHFLIRQEQLDVYSKTSTLAKAAKEQTDRVTVTVGAAYELAKRFSETAPPWERPGTERSSRGFDDDLGATQQPVAAKEDIYNRSNESTAASEGVSSINCTGDRHETDDGSLSSLRKRELQRVAESQIPSASAETQPALKQDNGRDTFNERADAVSPALSSLPRSKIPKFQAQPLSSDDDLTAQSPNSDASHRPDNKATATTEENLPDGTSVEGLFSNPRVSKMLGSNDSNAQNPYAQRKKLPPKPLPEMVAAEEQRRISREESKAAETPANSQDAQTQLDEADGDIHRLAEAISQDQSSDPAFAMKESRVPSSRFGRFWEYSGLATSMAFGAVGEGFRRFAGGNNEGSLMLSEGNMNRLVAKLSHMRGAALKLGQMLSFQDSKLLPATINTVLQRVQDSADYMPSKQRDKVLRENLGQDWRDLFSDFEDKPFAAASIGQVHRATLASNNQKVAVKVQYPGVKNSIDSDLNNLSLLLTASRLLPKGLFLDRTIANARVELAWECDYDREAQACIRFGELLQDETSTFTVPKVYTEASGPEVLTAEFMTGSGVTKIKDLTQSDRDWLGTQILRLCLRELMEWRFMQTDPNWTNFLYNRESQKLELLDFGASREFPDKFVVPYVSLLIAASKGDRDSCRDLSIELGYLTGHEGKDMVKAHVDSVLTLAEPFVENAPEVYDFEDQTITDRVRANIGLMLRERLAPPPEETYSLHRKLSGAFLLCARMRSRVRAREMFATAVEVWNGRAAKVQEM